MKKLLNLVVLLLLMASCASQNEPQQKSRAALTGNIEKFNMYGEMHNAMLMAINDNQELDTRLGKCATLDETLNALVEIQKGDIDNLPMASAYKSGMKDQIAEYKDFYVSDNLLRLFHSNGSADQTIADESEFRTMIDKALEVGAVDQFEYNLMSDLSDLVLKNEKGLISAKEILVEVNNMIAMWEKNYRDVDFTYAEAVYLNNQYMVKNFNVPFTKIPKGYLSGVILNISRSSMEYWITSGSALETRAIPAIVANDIAGALWGGSVAALKSYLTTHSVNWSDVGIGALSCGVSCSTGILGRLGRWIGRL